MLRLKLKIKLLLSNMCKTLGRIRMWIGIVLMPIRIRIRISIKMEIRSRIQIGIKARPIHSTL
jgi:hypothetical protein